MHWNKKKLNQSKYQEISRVCLNVTDLPLIDLGIPTIQRAPGSSQVCWARTSFKAVFVEGFVDSHSLKLSNPNWSKWINQKSSSGLVARTVA